MSVADLTAAHVDKDALQELYRTDKTARDVLDHLARRERNWSEVTVDRLASNVWSEGSDASRPEIIQVLRTLEDVGCGRFVVGRGGHRSRFQWYVGMVAVGRHAAGQPAVIEEVGPETPSEEDEQANEDLPSDEIRDLTHGFQLRPDLLISFKLPADMSPGEAARLADFIKTLPFG